MTPASARQREPETRREKNARRMLEAVVAGAQGSAYIQGHLGVEFNNQHVKPELAKAIAAYARAIRASASGRRGQ